MPIRKLSEGAQDRDCLDGDHEIDRKAFTDLAHGTYEHTCPACGERKIFHVPWRVFG